MGTVTAAAPRSLADDLRARSDDELAVLLRLRPDLATPVPSDIGQLAARAATRASTARALDQLDRFTLTVVEALAVLPEPVADDDVAAVVGAPANATAGALDGLRARALIWGTNAEMRLVRTVHEILGPFPAGLGPPLQGALANHTSGRLAAMAEDLGLTPTGDRDSDVTALAETVSGRLDELLTEVSEDATAALRVLASGPPTGQLGHARRDVAIASARTPVDELLARGLVVPTGDSTVVLPREVGLRLRGGLLDDGVTPEPPEPATTTHDAAAVDQTAAAGAYDAVRQVESLLEAWSHNPPPVLRTGGLGVRELRRLPQLLDVDERTARLLVELSYAAGLLAPGRDADPAWLPTPAFDTWRNHEPARQWAVLAAAWLATSRTPGLIGSRDERGRLLSPLGTELDRPLAPEIRRATLDVLSRLPAGLAPRPEGVVDVVRFLRPRRSPRLRDDLVSWTLREAETLGLTGRGALASYARPLLDGRSPDDVAEALTPALPALLDHVLLQADLTAVAPGALQPELSRELAAMADVESTGGAAVYRFTPKSVHRALDNGRTAAELHEFLARLSRTPVPQPLSYLIDDVARRHGTLRVGTASAFVRCDDDTVLTEIMASPQAAALGARRIAPGVLVSTVDPATLLDRLHGLGYMPALEGTDGTLAIAKAAPRRAEASRTGPVVTERPSPTEATLARAVRALRAGERSAELRPSTAPSGELRHADSAQILAELRRAVERGGTVWIAFVDHDGVAGERVVDPVRLGGGSLVALDHRSGEVRTFALHRISAAVPVESWAQSTAMPE